MITQGAEYISFLAKHTPGIKSAEDFGPAVGCGVKINGDIVAAAAFHRVTDIDAMLTLSSSTPMWGSKLRTFGAKVKLVAFSMLKLKRLTAKTSSENRRARKLLEASGFKHEGTLRNGWNGNEDAEIYGCLEKEYRW